MVGVAAGAQADSARTATIKSPINLILCFIVSPSINQLKIKIWFGWVNDSFSQTYDASSVKQSPPSGLN
jgi:hypothetical protein